MSSFSLSPSQRAYLFDQERFLARLEVRAKHLFTDGYTVTDTPCPGLFVVVPPPGSKNRTGYHVHAIEDTCTCPFFVKQRHGEWLASNRRPVPCKHLRGLAGLVREMHIRLEQEGRYAECYRLRTHWLSVLDARRKKPHYSQEKACEGEDR